MIVQTKRARGYGAVLKGSQLTVTRENEHVVLATWGIKERTGEPYEFRVLLTPGECQAIARKAEA